MAKPNGIFLPDFAVEDIPNQCYQHLEATLVALIRQRERYCKGRIDRAKWPECERANASIEPISAELRRREPSGARR